jgi:hypothetical protein
MNKKLLIATLLITAAIAGNWPNNLQSSWDTGSTGSSITNSIDIKTGGTIKNIASAFPQITTLTNSIFALK